MKAKTVGTDPTVFLRFLVAKFLLVAGSVLQGKTLTSRDEPLTKESPLLKVSGTMMIWWGFRVCFLRAGMSSGQRSFLVLQGMMTETLEGSELFNKVTPSDFVVPTRLSVGSPVKMSPLLLD